MCEYCLVHDEFVQRAKNNSDKPSMMYFNKLSYEAIEEMKQLTAVQLACRMEDFSNTDERSLVFN